MSSEQQNANRLREAARNAEATIERALKPDARTMGVMECQKSPPVIWPEPAPWAKALKAK